MMHRFVLTVSVHCTQVAALKTMAIQGGPTYRLSQQPWAQPGRICLRNSHWHHTAIHPNFVENAKGHVDVFFLSALSLSLSLTLSLVFFVFFLAKINDIVMATYRVMKSKLPSTLQSMSLYLANRDTEFILFKPVRVGGTDALLW